MYGRRGVLGLTFRGIFIVGITVAFVHVLTVNPVSSWDITPGSVDISTSPGRAVVSFGGMAPGDSVTAPLTVSNDGSLPLLYSVMSTTSEDTLAAQLDMTIKTNVTKCSDAGFDRDGEIVYGPGDLGSTAGLELVGDPALGLDPGDRVLEASESETLCIQVSLPTGTGNAFQGLTTALTLLLIAEQIPEASSASR